MKKFVMNENCFDVLRLVAALNVMLGHTWFYCKLNPYPDYLEPLFNNAIGVIIFFIISGYLITGSWERCFLGGAGKNIFLIEY